MKRSRSITKELRLAVSRRMVASVPGSSYVSGPRPHDNGPAVRGVDHDANMVKTGWRGVGGNVPDGIGATDVERDALEDIGHLPGGAWQKRHAATRLRELLEALGVGVRFDGIDEHDGMDDDVGRLRLIQNLFERGVAGVVAAVAHDDEHLAFVPPPGQIRLP